MIITIFGGSGGIGKFLINYAIEEGYQVKAYVRNPNKIDLYNPNLEVIKGDLNDLQGIRKAISGAYAVISTLGSPLNYSYNGYPVLDGHKNIIAAMHAENISRFITLATPSVKFFNEFIFTNLYILSLLLSY